MGKNIDNILSEFLGEIEKDVVARANSKDQNTSNKIPKSLAIETKSQALEWSGTLTGWEWIVAAWETGRGATKNKGDGALRRGIRKWIDRKGIVPKGNFTDENKAKDSLAYVISKKIHEQGTLLHNSEDERFGATNKSGTISDFINEKRVQALAEDISKYIVESTITPFLNASNR